MDNKTWYPEPTQIQYFNGLDWSKGIAFNDYIISLYSGKAYTIDQIYSSARKLGVKEDAAIIEKCEWVNIFDFLNN